MKSISKIIGVLLTTSIFFVLLSGFVNSNGNILTVENEKDEKIYANATLREDFADDTVIVVLDKNTGGINKAISESLFGNIEMSAVKDLTVVKVPENLIEIASVVDKINGETDMINSNHLTQKINIESFRQIIKITLPKKSKSNVLEVIKQLEKIEGVLYVGPDYYENHEAIPNDEHYDAQWAFESGFMNMEAAWDITTGSTSVKVGVMDTGIAAHPDSYGNVILGWDFINNNTYIVDDPTIHGTHVAGIIGAVGNNSIGVAGVCWNVSLVPLQVVELIDGEYRIPASAQIEAITFATNNDIPIINYSGGGIAVNSARNTAITNYPGLFVCSAGNEKLDTDITKHYPSELSRTLDNVISVGASTSADTVADNWVQPDGTIKGSNYGAESVSVFAPGENIMSTVLEEGVTDYKSRRGTSMAAPQVTGTAALIMSVCPDITPEQLKACILGSVDKIPTLEGKCVTGGRLNTYKALKMAIETRDSFTGDVNGDGKADMIVTHPSGGKREIKVFLGQSDGTFGAPITTLTTSDFIHNDPCLIGDANGDGRDDLIVHTHLNGKRLVQMFAGKTDGTFMTAALTATTASHNYYSVDEKYLVADVNGDGRDDLIVHGEGANGARESLVFKGRATGGFYTATSAATSAYSYDDSYPVLTGDFNGDGRDDLLVVYPSGGKRCLMVFNGTASTPNFASGVTFLSDRDCDPINNSYDYIVSDVNGDGKDDLVVEYKGEGNSRWSMVYKGGPSGLQTEAIDSSTQGISHELGMVALSGDFNGDGRGDVLSQGTSPGRRFHISAYCGQTDATFTSTFSLKQFMLSPTTTPITTFLDDVNGDGRDDCIVEYNNNGYIFLITYLANADGTFGSEIYTQPTISVPYYNYTPN